MKAMVCELCSSNAFSKIDDMFQCDYCRTRYTTEQAKKLIVEGVVTVDRGEEAENLLLLAKESFRHGQHEEAVDWARRVLEIDPNNYEASFITGMCKMFESLSIANLCEARERLGTALEGATGDQREQYISQIITVALPLAKPMFWANSQGLAQMNTTLYARTLAHAEFMMFAYRLSHNEVFAKSVSRGMQLAANSIKVTSNPAKVGSSRMTAEQAEVLLALNDEAERALIEHKPKHKTKPLKFKKALI